MKAKKKEDNGFGLEGIGIVIMATGVCFGYNTPIPDTLLKVIVSVIATAFMILGGGFIYIKGRCINDKTRKK